MLCSSLVVDGGWKGHWIEDKTEWNEYKLTLWCWKAAWLLRLWDTILSRSYVMKINESGRLESCFLKFETQGDIWHYSIKRKIHLEQEKNAFKSVSYSRFQNII